MSGKPNILLIMCDQLHAGVPGCYGGPAHTPHIDALARDGVRFRQATCPYPVCSPSRASLATGLFPHTHGIVHNVFKHDYPSVASPETEEGIKRADVTTDRLLAESGYAAHHYGKWHLSDEPLDYFSDMFTEHGEYAAAMRGTFAQVRAQYPADEWMDWYGWALPVALSDAFRPVAAQAREMWAGKKHGSFLTKMGKLLLDVESTFDYMVADRTIGCIRKYAAPGSRPFMITCSFNSPHDPNVVPAPYYDDVDPDSLALPANGSFMEERYARDWSTEAVRALGERGLREFLRIYYASVKLIDDQVGRVLQALEDSGKAEDTVVVFAADHGDMAGGHRMIWKSTSAFYEELVRVPFIIRYPGKLQPKATDVPACLTDVMPSVLHLAGVPVPDHVQGHNLIPYVTGEKAESEAPVYTFCERIPAHPQRLRVSPRISEGSFMVRGNGFKYIRYADGGDYLYDLAADPGELNNVSGAARFEEQKRELREALREWLAAPLRQAMRAASPAAVKNTP